MRGLGGQQDGDGLIHLGHAGRKGLDDGPDLGLIWSWWMRHMRV